MKYRIDRDSNFELLRIVAMLLMLIDHAGYMSIQPPTQIEVNEEPMLSFCRFSSQALSSVCVNVFVLISGWFGIKMKLSRIVEFLFQCYFICIILYLGLLLGGYAIPMTASEWINFLLLDDLWFVKAFLLLYLFAPMLNLFVDSLSQRSFMWFVIAFATIQTAHGFITQAPWFDKGQSPLSMMFLYFFGRYLHCYPCRITKFDKLLDMTLYILISLITAFLAFISVKLGAEGYRLFSYASPLLIMASVFLFLFFSKLSFKSPFVNWIAASSFAIYVVNCENHSWSIYTRTIGLWWKTETIGTFIAYTSVTIAIVFLIAIIIDKIRYYLYRLIS